jgi:DDE superfamily endonuclease
MELPLVAPAPLVTRHAAAFRDLFANRCQFAHFEHYLTGLLVLENKSLANIARCVLDSADKTNVSRFFSAADWDPAAVNDRRINYLLAQTRAQRQRKVQSALVLDDTLCEHVGSLFEHVDQHYNHGDGTYPVAHNPVTSFYVSGGVRFPLDLRLYRRYEEITQWTTFVATYFPGRLIPTKKQERARLHKEVDPVLLRDPAFVALHEQFRTKISLAIELVEAAIRHKVPFGVLLFDGWYLSEELVQVAARRHKAWISILKKNRNLETASFVLKDATGEPVPLAGPHIAVEDLVPHIPPSAYRAVTVGVQTYWCFTVVVRVPSLGKVRVVISFAHADLHGSYVVLVTNQREWSAHQIIVTYLLRWPTETFYQDSKGHLGLDTYRMRSAEAITKHWCLVFVAYSFLHLACLPPPLACRSVPRKTIGEMCRQQAEALIQQRLLYTHAQLLGGAKVDDVFTRVFAKQRRLLPA